MNVRDTKYDHDVEKASQALITWFDSQHIPLGMSVEIMATVIACVFGEVEETREGMQKKVDLLHQVLTEYVDEIDRECQP